MGDGATHSTGQTAETIKQSRRRLLCSLGAGGALTLAGCVGGDAAVGDGTTGDADGASSGDGAGDDGDTPSSVSDNPTKQACNMLSTDLSPYQTGQSVMLVNFDIPSPLEGEFGTGVGEFVHQSIQRVEGENGATELSIQVMAQYTEQEVYTYEPDQSMEVALETDFQGRSVEMYQLGGNMPEGISARQRFFAGNFPYTVDGVQLYFPVTVRTEVDPAPDQSVPESCVSTMTEVTEAIASSLRLNEQNTLAETIPEQWEEWPPE